MSPTAYKSFFFGVASGILFTWFFMSEKFFKRPDPSPIAQGTVAIRVAQMQKAGKSQDYIDNVVKIIKGHQAAKALKVKEAIQVEEANVVSPPKISEQEILSLTEQLKLESENSEWFAAVRAHKSKLCDDQDLPDPKKQRAM